MHPLLERMWKTVPRPVQDLVATTVDRVQGIRWEPAPGVSPDHSIRVFTGPVNYAGQGWAWGQAAMVDPRVAARNLVGAENNLFRYSADYHVRWRTMEHDRSWQRHFLEHLSRTYTHVMVEASTPLIGGLFGGDLRRQVGALRSAGLRVAMIGHGTEVRLPSRHRELEAWSYFANDDWVPVERFERVVQANLDAIGDIGATVFVSTAGLLLDLPQAHWLPVVVDPNPWTSDAAVLERERARVIHAPSNPVPKGTLMVRPALQRLHAEGIIEYTEITGLTQDEMPSLYAGADIVLDQFRTGDYGVASCEAMAAGRVVLGHVSDHARGVVASETGHDLPIVETTVDDIENRLRDIVNNRDRYRAIAARGPGFVRAVHDGTVSRRVLLDEFLAV